MLNRWISLFMAILMTVTVFTALPFSVAAIETDDPYETPSETTVTATEEPASEPVTQAETEAPTEPIDETVEIPQYPCITHIENLSSGAEITWDRFESNTLYRVYYRKASTDIGSWDDKYAGDGWTRLATVRGNRYIHTDLSDAQIGIYTVRSVGDSGSFTSDFNAEGWENCYYAPPKLTSAVFDENGVHLTWDQAWRKHGLWNGEHYRVYRKTVNTSWTRLAQTDDDHFTDDTAIPGVNYYYTLRMVDSTGTRFLSDCDSGTAVSFNAYPYVNKIENQESGARISWFAYPNAAAYRIYCRSVNGWTRLMQLSGTSYTDLSVKDSSTRVYTVRALDAKNQFISDFKAEGWTNTYYRAPVIRSIQNTTEGVKLTWIRPEGAQDYRVYRRNGSGWLRLTQTDSSEFTDTTAVSGAKYTYTLRMITADGEAFMSDCNSGKSITYVAAPVITNMDNLQNGVKLTWTPIKGADFYRIYYRSESGWTRLASKYLTEYIDTTVADGETREYTVRCLDKNENFVSDFYRDGAVNTFYAPPVIRSLTANDQGVTVSWDKPQGAEDYRVYRKTNETSWKLLAQTDECSYTDTSYEKGVTYIYTIRMITADSSRFMSYCNSGKTILWCETPRLYSAVNAESGVALKWNAVKGAPYYRIYYRDDDGWNRLATVKEASFIDKEITDSGTRVYTVRCISSKGDFASGFDADGLAQTYVAPPQIDSIGHIDNAYLLNWSNKPHIASYRVYRRCLGDNDWQILADRSKDDFFIDDNTSADTICSYTLCALDENGTPISAYLTDQPYYQNGKIIDGVITLDDTTYRFDNGVLFNGYFYQGENQYYYRDGVRVDDRFNNGAYQAKYNRTHWLYELMRAVNPDIQINTFDPRAVFDAAVERGIIDDYSSYEFFFYVDRRYAAQTIYHALGYEKRSLNTGISDIKEDDAALDTIAYYGYFLPDSKDRIFPEAKVTPQEFDYLLSQLHLYRSLKGKTVISFGDSIMHGRGNNNLGISVITAEKYGMIWYDYSVNGATMGICGSRSHIPDQIRAAINDKRQPDLILINGGTNDMYHGVTLGNMCTGDQLCGAQEDTFSAGMEKSMWLFKTNWKNVPVIYIRVHNMDLGSDSKERLFGVRGLQIAKKWNAAGIDMYNNSGMNTENDSICRRYTLKLPEYVDFYDSIHPTALGYATFYLPAVEKMLALTTTE